MRKAKSILPGSSPLLWHVALEDLGELKLPEDQETHQLDQAQIQQKKQQALKLLQNEKDAYDFRLHSSKQQGKWLLQVLNFSQFWTHFVDLDKRPRDSC